jgi:hypothetical protein
MSSIRSLLTVFIHATLSLSPSAWLGGNQKVKPSIQEAETASFAEQKHPLSAYSDLFFLRNGSNRSIGIGKRVVELLSAETSLRV